MEEGLKVIENNHTWELVTLPHNKRFIGVKWVYRVKVKSTGEVAKYKARLIAKEFLQKAGLDYNEVFAPVAKIETTRLVVVAAIFRDVKLVFLNGPLEEEIYVCQPPGFKVTEHEDKVCRLKKALYGLKQAPRAWNRRIDDEFKRRIMLDFEMTYLGLLSYFLGMKFVTTGEGISMHQKMYATDVLKSIKLEKEGSDELIDATLYKQIVDSFRFLCNSRPDIAYGVRLISRFMDNPKLSHLLATKRILRYVKGILDYGMLFSKRGRSVSDEIYGYYDSDCCGDKSDKKVQQGMWLSYVEHLFHGVLRKSQ
ncbi:hypothetical protein CR513_29870, partial [Mucuna pruriens]